MQVWTDPAGTKQELRLTVGVAWRLLKHFTHVDVLGSPEEVEVMLARPDYLLPLAVAMGAAPDIALADCEQLGKTLDGPAYASLLTAVQDELTDFFQEPTKSRLLEIRALTQQEQANRMQQMRAQVAQTASVSTGPSSVSNGPASLASTLSPGHHGNSTSCSEAAHTSSGTTQPA